MGNHRTFNHDEILNLFAGGMSQAEIAKRVGMSRPGISQVVNRARLGGDARAVGKRDVAQKPPVTRLVEPSGVMVVTVITSQRNGDGSPRRASISLPRLSILDGWSGPATAYLSRGAT